MEKVVGSSLVMASRAVDLLELDTKSNIHWGGDEGSMAQAEEDDGASDVP